MEYTITEDGTQAFYLRPGRWIFSMGGTLAAGAVVSLLAGYSEDGSDHRPLLDDSATAIAASAETLPEPQTIQGGTHMSLVTAEISTSSGLVASFRYIGQ